MRNDIEQFEQQLRQTVERLVGSGCAPGLAAAVRQAVLSRGKRLRPRLCYATWRAAGGQRPGFVDDAAVAIELIHCASLVHDDLPCFDDANTRRGAPTVHRAFGQPIAVLCGDALLIAAFDAAAHAATLHPASAARLVSLIAAAAGPPLGMTAAQAWESEPLADLQRYHDGKSAALFACAAMAGALAAGDSPGGWHALGLHIGRAYQLADDLCDVDEDVLGDRDDLGAGCINAARLLGHAECKARLGREIELALAAIPDCPGQHALRGFVADLLGAVPVWA